ncbi:MAG: hypothetical protein WDN46_08860 [Methylocella sp.]
MRSLSTITLAAILGFALPAATMAAPSTINDCEKIQAADAYNQCLAIFGPVAHTHGAATAKDFGGDGDGDGSGADVVETASPEASVAQKERHSSHGRHSVSRGSRHYHYHYHSHKRSSSAQERHAHGKTLAFSVISGHTKVR